MCAGEQMQMDQGQRSYVQNVTDTLVMYSRMKVSEHQRMKGIVSTPFQLTLKLRKNEILLHYYILYKALVTQLRTMYNVKNLQC